MYELRMMSGTGKTRIPAPFRPQVPSEKVCRLAQLMRVCLSIVKLAMPSLITISLKPDLILHLGQRLGAAPIVETRIQGSLKIALNVRLGGLLCRC